VREATQEAYESKSLTASRKVLVTATLVDEVKAVLLNPAKPMAERTRAIFTLRNLGGPLAVHALAAAFADGSALLKHEAAYALGQLQEAAAVPLLAAVLADEAQPVIVRHEAGEALGALAAEEALPLLRSLQSHASADLRETCELAVARIEWARAAGAGAGPSKFLSFDPAPPAPAAPVAKHAAVLADEQAPLFERYRALFALRDAGGEEALAALEAALAGAGSALLRHEVAFVLGQLSEPAAAAALAEAAGREQESAMVRHEAIEALGELSPSAAPGAAALIARLAAHPEPVVAESCHVALDLAAHNASATFEYADAADAAAAAAAPAQ